MFEFFLSFIKNKFFKGFMTALFFCISALTWFFEQGYISFSFQNDITKTSAEKSAPSFNQSSNDIVINKKDSENDKNKDKYYLLDIKYHQINDELVASKNELNDYKNAYNLLNSDFSEYRDKCNSSFEMYKNDVALLEKQITDLTSMDSIFEEMNNLADTIGKNKIHCEQYKMHPTSFYNSISFCEQFEKATIRYENLKNRINILKNNENVVMN